MKLPRVVTSVVLVITAALTFSSLTPTAAFADDAPAPAPGSIIPWDSPACADLTFIGARGSGEGRNEGEIDWYGPEVSLAASTLRGRVVASLPNVTTKYTPVSYAALNADYTHLTNGGYESSVASGVVNFVSAVSKTVQDCPNTKMVFVGYSQGSQVILDGSRQLTEEQLKNVVYIWVMAPPVLNHGESPDPKIMLNLNEMGNQYQPNVMGMINAATKIGLGSRAAEVPYPSQFKKNVVEVCHSEDLVCGISNVASPQQVQDYFNAVNSLNTVHGTAYKDATWMNTVSGYLFFELFLSLV